MKYQYFANIKAQYMQILILKKFMTRRVLLTDIRIPNCTTVSKGFKTAKR